MSGVGEKERMGRAAEGGNEEEKDVKKVWISKRQRMVERNS